MEVETQPRYCYRHPDRETGLSCSECGKSICYECMTPAPVGLRCPEHSGKPQGVRKATVAAERVVTKSGTRLSRHDGADRVNVGVFLLELAMGGTASGTSNEIFNQGALLANGVIQNGQLYGVTGGRRRVSSGRERRLVAVMLTSAFLHAGPIHLGLNMLALYWFGRVLEHVIGSLRFALLYLASGLAGAAGALYLSPNVPTVGASERDLRHPRRCSCSSAGARSRVAARFSL
jgi:hypothetical protein